MATRIIAVLNQKGGVGKTTTSVNLGAGLARRGRQVLLVDMDPQANLTVHLGIDPHRAKATSYSLLLGEHSLSEAMVDTATPGLRVVPSTLALANAEIQLASAVGRELILTEAIQNWLHPTAEPWEQGASLPFASGPEATAPPADFVLIDCPPSLGILTMNALCCATDVLLPIQTEFFALQGVAGILESLKAVKRLNKNLKLSLVLPSMVDFRTNLAKDVIEEVRKYFGPLVAKSVIRTNVKLAEAPSHGETIFQYAPNSRGAEDYGALADEVLGIGPDGSGEAEEAPVAGVAPASPEAPVAEASPSEPSPPEPPQAVDEPFATALEVVSSPDLTRPPVSPPPLPAVTVGPSAAAPVPPPAPVEPPSLPTLDPIPEGEVRIGLPDDLDTADLPARESTPAPAPASQEAPTDGSSRLPKADETPAERVITDDVSTDRTYQ